MYSYSYSATEYIPYTLTSYLDRTPILETP